jgi:hypothetical protein
MDFPTKAEVEKADLETLARWYRFLLSETADQQKVLALITERFKEKGGMTPALSRKIGYGGV